MVARIISGQSVRGLLNYNENKVSEGQAKLIMASRFGTELDKLSFKAKLNRFEHLTFLNAKVKTNSIHIMLNFDKQDKIDPLTFQQIAASYMERIGFGDQPYLVYQHLDASHPHLHVVTTNMQADGNRMDIHGIGRTLSETARKELETEFNLIKAEGRNKSEVLFIQAVDIEKAVYGKTPTKKAINQVVSGVMNNYKFTSLAEYNALLKQFNVIADRGKEDTVMFEKRGLIYSMIDEKGNRIGIPFKASLLSGKPTLDRIEKKFERNKEQRKPHKDTLKASIDKLFNKFQSITKSTFIRELEKQQIAVVFRQNEQGFIFGTTFIDHRSKCIFNGSDLGKAYSTKALMKCFGNTDQPKTYLKPLPPQNTYLKQETDHPEKIYLNPVSTTSYLKSLLDKPQGEYLPMLPKKKKKRKKGITI